MDQSELFKGILSRSAGIHSMPLSTSVGDRLQILVENQGRVGYGKDNVDFKGLISEVQLGGKPLHG